VINTGLNKGTTVVSIVVEFRVVTISVENNLSYSEVVVTVSKVISSPICIKKAAQITPGISQTTLVIANRSVFGKSFFMTEMISMSRDE